MEYVGQCVRSNASTDSSSDSVGAWSHHPGLWILIDSILLLFIVTGNILTILAITLSRRLRHVTSNYFVLSLAVSDLLVGLTLPYHLAFYVNPSLNKTKLTCLLRFVIISSACGGSIYNIIAIAVDRYIAIVHPLRYPSHRTSKAVTLVIIVGWIYTINVASIPLYWNCYDITSTCELETVLPRYYTVALLMPSFFLVWLTIFVLYWQIWREASTHVRRLQHNGLNGNFTNDRKSVQVVFLVLGCFSVCWLPFLVIACTRSFDWYRTSTPALYKATFSLAMANSGINPLIYAWKNHNFRKAFQMLLNFQSPNSDFNSSLKKYLKKQHELAEANGQSENNANPENGELRTIYKSDMYSSKRPLQATTL